jgi:glycerophosphoryl diester phosphodiesterase
MPFKLIILGHRGEGCTNRDPATYKRNLPPRNDPFFENQILPENSLSAFASALRHGADGIECDVYISKDGIPMVAHDDELARNVDGYHYWGSAQNDTILGRISDFTASELQAKFTIGNNEPIPTLDDLMQLMMHYNISYRKKFVRNLTINI